MKIAINGFGRIGRIFYRQASRNPNMEIVAINDLGDKNNLLYLLDHDSVYGKFNVDGNGSDIRDVRFLQEKDPGKLPWGELGIDVVVESTGAFRTYEKAHAHIDAGAKRVVITAPAKDEQTQTFTPNVIAGDGAFSDITSNASCTTNSVTPVIAVLLGSVGIEKALLTTIHGYTATQELVDSSNEKDYRKGRAAAHNLVPTSTGAAIAAAKVVPGMQGKFDGVAVRAPIIVGSLTDFTFIASRETSAGEINKIFEDASKSEEWDGIIKIADKGTVSSDIIGERYGAIIDTEFTRVVDSNLVKIMAWYDNEWGYSAMLIKHIETLQV